MTDIVARNAFIEAHYRSSHENTVRSIAHKVGFHNAEDAVQEAYARALEHWESFDEEKGPFRVWFASVLNSAISAVLRGDRDSGREMPANSLTTQPAGEASYQLKQIDSLLMQERPKKRHALVLALVHGYAYDIVATITGLSVANIWASVSRFRSKIT